ncbi:Tudor domain-containing protein [Camponotus japonicus]
MEIESIDTTHLCSWHQEVRVVCVESPLLFWVQLRNDEKAYEKLQNTLQIKMAANKKLITNIQEDQVVSVMHNKLWHRGIITRVSRIIGAAEIFLKDIGRKICLAHNELYELDDEFRRLPWRAIACALIHTGSEPPTSTWPEVNKNLARIVAEGNKEWINIVQPLWKGAALVNLRLKSINFDASYDFKEALIKLGIARPSKNIMEHISPAV